MEPDQPTPPTGRHAAEDQDGQVGEVQPDDEVGQDAVHAGHAPDGTALSAGRDRRAEMLRRLRSAPRHPALRR